MVEVFGSTLQLAPLGKKHLCMYPGLAHLQTISLARESYLDNTSITGLILGVVIKIEVHPRQT